MTSRTRTHLVTSGTLSSQLAPVAAAIHLSVSAPISDTSFDLMDVIENVNTTYLRNQLLSSMSFSLKGFLTAGLNSLLVEFWAISQREGAAVSFDSYADCLRYVESINFNTSSLEDMGMDAINPRVRLQAIVDMCLTMHALIKSHKGDAYIIPTVEQLITEIKAKKVGAKTASKIAIAAEEDADGDAEEQAHLAKVYLDKAGKKLALQHEWDVNRSKALVQLGRCMNFDENVQDENAYDALDAMTQYKLIRSLNKAITRALEWAADDDSIDTHEYRSMRIEAKALRETVTTAMTARKFADLDI